MYLGFFEREYLRMEFKGSAIKRISQIFIHLMRFEPVFSKATIGYKGNSETHGVLHFF